MADRLLQVARVAGAFGVRGEIRITTFTEDPLALATYRVLTREDGSPGLTITAARAVKGAVIARAAGIDTRDQAEALRGLKLFIAREALPAPDEDEFYHADLLGLTLETPEGELMGKVKTIQDFGAGDLIEVQPPMGASWWLPFTRETVPEVRIAEGKLIAVRPAEIDGDAEEG
ncbi:MAG: ribosome maturation factor RimM [Phenylobacterium sp.]|uniref:ribosome maturation factor RimM n=1 Tax=Phenylobacterium sp. TaxID=1871053 RepID=UPI002717BF0E|nr:ribosome maturation factor RimM [Phenylobacterium sp.]MDO8910802.1 ribosome maturation factor RimM [Phenylobacterium sp.]MDP3101033.1 ribosome maturation factor RimM [Phenylobacterium sp.]MDP3632861.1 ribosome maturation factor RimM [Phenylobacterium sp.]MDP3866960.1 ribosome maturation factor RimM [Phenylobacterium sp.]HQT51894.1 ribosome maturation factor RimM [Phenylobacterium sp.]